MNGVMNEYNYVEDLEQYKYILVIKFKHNCTLMSSHDSLESVGEYLARFNPHHDHGVVSVRQFEIVETTNQHV